MSTGASYRGYLIYHDGSEHVAEPAVGGGDNFEISSKDQAALFAAIDELWAHLNAAKSVNEPAPVPAWYKSWLDGGACGRVRLMEHGKHESIVPRSRWRWAGKISAGALVCMAAVISIPRLDVNGDGLVDFDDYSALVEKAYLASPPKMSHQRIRFDKRVYDVMLTPAPDDGVDFDARDIKIGVSVKKAAATAVDAAVE